MTGEPITTVVGNLAADPELRFTPSGAAVANFTVASTPRTFNKQTNEWDDGETWWLRCAVWRDAAENVAESLSKGMRVVVTGRLKSRSYEKDNVKHTVIEMDVDEVGPSLRYASARVTKADRSGGQQQQGGGFGQPAQQAEFGGQVQAGQQAQQSAQQPAPWGQQPQQAPAWGQQPQQGWPQQQPAQAPQQQDPWTTGGGAAPQTDPPPY